MTQRDLKMENNFFVNLLRRWAEEDVDGYVDSVCPVDGAVIAHQQVNALQPAPDMPMNPYAPREFFDGSLVSAARAVRKERIGGKVDRFEEFYTGDSEDYLEGVIEALGGMPHMSYHDAVNAINVD